MGGQIAGTSGDPTNDLALGSLQRNLRADCIAVAPRTLQLKTDPRVFTPHIVAQQNGRLAQARKNRIGSSVIVPISDSQPPTQVSLVESWPGLRAHIRELPFAVVVQQ